MTTHSDNHLTEIFVWNVEGMCIFTFVGDQLTDDMKLEVKGIEPVRMKLHEYPAYRQKCLREYVRGLDG